jgi:hypothetical protein
MVQWLARDAEQPAMSLAARVGERGVDEVEWQGGRMYCT